MEPVIQNRKYRIHCRRAFTLIELIVVIVIMAVIAASVVPAYEGFLARSRFNATVEQVRDLFAYAREKAITGDTTTTLTYVRQSGTFVVDITPPAPVTDLPIAVSSTDNPDTNTGTMPASRTYSLGPDYAVANFTVGGSEPGSAGANTNTSGGQGVNFQSDGTCDGAQLVLISSSGHSVQMVLTPSTGLLTVVDNSGMQL